MTKEQLQDFEEKIAKLFEDGKIKAPVHLSKGNEEHLIEIFKDVKKSDWIFSTWRNHLHWLLSGRAMSKLEKQILEGNSMAVTDHRFFTSAIVGGISPIAVGVALSIELKKDMGFYKTQALLGKEAEDIPTPNVWCFLGDMGAACGISKESIKYAEGHDLPITFVIEDNGLSITTDTKEVWGRKHGEKTREYKYEIKRPHAGTGKFVLF